VKLGASLCQRWVPLDGGADLLMAAGGWAGAGGGVDGLSEVL
jgi:hypothetical protein